MKKELRKRQRESEQLSEKIDHLDRQLDQLRCLAEYDSIKRWELTVHECKKLETLEADILRVVFLPQSVGCKNFHRE